MKVKREMDNKLVLRLCQLQFNMMELKGNQRTTSGKGDAEFEATCKTPKCGFGNAFIG